MDKHKVKFGGPNSQCNYAVTTPSILVNQAPSTVRVNQTRHVTSIKILTPLPLYK